MSNDDYLINAERIDALVRRAGEERAYFLGEAIGNVLLAARIGLEAAGRWLRYSATRSHSNARALRRRRTHFTPQNAHVTVR